MTTTATHDEPGHPTETTLFVAFELREKTWKLGFTTGHGQKPRERTVTARQQERVLDDIAQATRRVGLPDSAPVVSGSEAGREGFWLHRFVQAHGIISPGVDSAAIEGNRRQRRAKSDGLDVRTLLRMLMRYHSGEHQVWQVVTVPTVAAAAQRHRHRDVETLKQERASTTTRLKGLLSRQGLRVASLTKVPEPLEALRLWDGSPMPPGLRRRVLRVYAPPTCLSEQMAAGGSGASRPTADIDRHQDRQGAPGDAAPRDWDQWRGVVSPGLFRLACLHASSGSGGLSGLHADAVSQRRACPRAREKQVGQPACALDDHRVSVELAPLAA